MSVLIMFEVEIKKKATYSLIPTSSEVNLKQSNLQRICF